jgi:topoisomerase-4 subunit B
MKTNSGNDHKLSLLEHIQIRPTLYIGRLGDGTLPDDGIYILLKEVRSVPLKWDEFKY